MEKLEINIVIERGNPNVGFNFTKDGQIVRYEALDADERQKVVNALAGGYGLFAGRIDIEQEASEVQLR